MSHEHPDNKIYLSHQLRLELEMELWDNLQRMVADGTMTEVEAELAYLDWEAYHGEA